MYNSCKEFVYIMSIVSYDVSKSFPHDLSGIIILEEILYGVVNNHPIGRSAVPFESIELYSNNDRTFRVFVKTPDLNIVDLTNAEGVFTVKKSHSESEVVFSKSTKVDGEGELGSRDVGEMFFYVLPSDTDKIPVSQYVYDVKIVLPSGRVYTIIEGVINLKKSL